MNSIELELASAFEVYPKRDLCIVSGKGAEVTDSNGNTYIDCVAGIGVANVGHTNPSIVNAVATQAKTLITCPGIFYNDIRGQCMRRLIDIAPEGMSKAFLCNSGTEAMEAALKFARISTGKNEFISAMRGFHGRSMGALSATFKYRQEFEPLIPGHHFVPFNNIEKLTAAITDQTAAVVIELIQGEGGVRPASREYAKQVRELCDAKNVLLIVDEVQTGFARTGSMFASQHYGICPDIMALSKAIAGGVPMGAVLCTDNVEAVIGKHGSTFGGNPLASAACIANIDYIVENNLTEAATSKGARFVQRFTANQPALVREIRQTGLMIGIELKIKSKPVLEALMERGILALPAGPTVVRLLPPLIISEDALDTVCDTLLEVLNQ